jgi:hypothetical protein
MSRASMTDAATTLPRAPIFGIASCPVGATGLLEFEIGWDEFERDVQWAESLIRSSGLGPGDLVLITISQWEGPWTSPVVTALRRIGITYLTAEVWNFDARRTSMFLQRLPVKAVFGLAGETLVALGNEDPPIAELLRNVEFLWARPDAVAHLSGTAPQILPFVHLGPALALGVPGQSGALVNAAEWAVDAADGELVVSNTAERATRFDRTPTGVRGSVRSVSDGAAVVDLDQYAAQ